MSCGMAVAFGAPIGGTLFGFEISQPNTYWQFTSMWRTFLTCTLGVVVYSFCIDLWYFDGWVLNSAPLRFNSITFPIPTFESIPTSIVIGSLCGLVGSGWTIGNTYVNMFRKLYYTTHLQKCAEVTVLAFITTTMFYWLPFWAQAKCFKQPDTYSEEVYLVQYNCPKDFYNPLATLFMNTEGTVIRTLVGGY